MDRKLSESCWSEEECMEKCGLVKVSNYWLSSIREEGICFQGPSCTVKEEKECSPVQQQKCETAYEQVID